VPCGGEDSCQGDSAVPRSIGNAQGSETLDRCDDLQAGQTHEHTLDDIYSRIALGRCLQDCVSLILWSVVSPRAASVPRVALSPRLRCAGTLVGGYFTGSFSTDGGSLSKTALRWYFARWLLHGQLQYRGWRCVQDCVHRRESVRL
jgi:hypothetical protein